MSIGQDLHCCVTFEIEGFVPGGTLRISGWGCAAGTLEPLTYTRATILDKIKWNSQPPSPPAPPKSRMKPREGQKRAFYRFLCFVFYLAFHLYAL